MRERVLGALLGVPFLLGAAAAPGARDDVAFRFQDPAITEASALVVIPDGLVVTSNDSGDTGRVFAVDGRTGRTVGVTQWETDPTDVEALAPGPPAADGGSTVWVGDIGDNSGSRSTVQLALVPIGRGDRTVHPTVYDLAYPDGPHDAETLVRNPVTGRLYVATKALLGGTLYAVSKRLSADRVNRLTAVGPVLPIATDGAFFPDGRHLIVRSYLAATVYAFPSLQPVRTLPLPAQPQGEGIGVTARGRVLLDSEGSHAAVLRLPLPRSLVPIVDPGRAPGPTPSEGPSPSATSPSAASPSAASPSATTATTAAPRSERDSGTHRPAYWALGAGVLVLGVLLATGVLRRRSRVE